MKTILASLALLCLCPTVQAQVIQPPIITVSCTPPLLWHTTRCECPDGSLPIYVMDQYPRCPTPPVACVVSVAYNSRAPAAPVMMVDRSPECDDLLEQALATVLARRLGAP